MPAHQRNKLNRKLHRNKLNRKLHEQTTQRKSHLSHMSKPKLSTLQ